MAELTDNQRIKLAFLLHTVYGIKDMSYALLKEISENKSANYLVEEGLLAKRSTKIHYGRSLNESDDTISDDLDRLMQ